MAEGRILKKRISESKKVAVLASDSTRLLYTWLIPFLDIEDRYSADPEIIKGHIFPKIKSWTINKIEKCLADLDDNGLIFYYEIDGEKYLQFKQTLQKKYPEREKASIIPAPPRNTEKSCGRMQPQDISTQIKRKEKKGKEIKLKESEIRKLYSKYKIDTFKTIEEFFDSMYEEMWKMWPKDGKLDKEAGREKFHNRCWEGKLEEMVAGVNGYFEFLRYQKEGRNFEQRAKYPKTFFEPKKARWKEYIDFKKPKKW